MTVDTSMAAPQPHYCYPPEITTWDRASGEWPPPVLSHLQEGTRFHCSCGKVWVVTHIPEAVGRYIVVCSHDEWQPETRRQRRQRLRHERREAKQAKR